MKKILLTALLGISFFIWPSTELSAQENKKPLRIISLYAGHTEILLRLGAKDNIIGVSAQETYNGPETEGFAPPVFSIRDDVEKFLAAQPDVILLRPMHVAVGSRVVGALKDAGIKIHAAQVTKAGSLYQYWRELAKIVGREDEAEKMIADFDQVVRRYHQAAEKRVDKPGIFVESIHPSIKTFTPDSLPMWLVELAGATNVASDAKATASGLMIADYGPERLLAKADDIDIFISQLGTMNSTPQKQVEERNIYQPIKAFKDGQVYKISESILARPTPTLLEGLAKLADLTGLAQEMKQQESQEGSATSNGEAEPTSTDNQ